MSASVEDNSASEAYSSDFFSDYESDPDDETVLFCKDEDSASKDKQKSDPSTLNLGDGDVFPTQNVSSMGYSGDDEGTLDDTLAW